MNGHITLQVASFSFRLLVIIHKMQRTLYKHFQGFWAVTLHPQELFMAPKNINMQIRSIKALAKGTCQSANISPDVGLMTPAKTLQSANYSSFSSLGCKNPFQNQLQREAIT